MLLRWPPWRSSWHPPLPEIATAEELDALFTGSPDLRSLAAADPERFGDAHAFLEELVVANLRGVSTSEHGGEFVPEEVGDIVKLLRGEQNR
jgi:hypothetical protein